MRFLKFVAYAYIDVFEGLKNTYYRIFDDTVVSLAVYTKDESKNVYHLLSSAVYPLRNFKTNDIFYEKTAMLEIVFTTKNRTTTALLPCAEVVHMSTPGFLKICKKSYTSLEMEPVKSLRKQRLFRNGPL